MGLLGIFKNAVLWRMLECFYMCLVVGSKQWSVCIFRMRLEKKSYIVCFCYTVREEETRLYSGEVA